MYRRHPDLRARHRTDDLQHVCAAVIKRDAKIENVSIENVPGVNCQEKTFEHLLESLRSTLTEAIDFNRVTAIGAGVQGFEASQIAV